MYLGFSVFLFFFQLSGVQASDLCERVLRDRKYRSVSQKDLTYDGDQIFKDAQDTETVSAVGLTAIREGDFVLDLGSGSGIPANAFSQKASRVVGIDISEVSVAHARGTYGSAKTSFFQGDYKQTSANDIVQKFCGGQVPDLIVSNPPYVPSTGHSSGLLKTIDGGPYGIGFVSRVIEIASTLNTRVAFITGSYSSPLIAFRLLARNGYRITHFTFSALPFGKFSEANRERILELEKEGHAYLLRNVYKDRLGYAAIGFVAEKTTGLSISEAEFLHLLARVSSSGTRSFENLPSKFKIPIRVLVLDDSPK